MLVEFNKYKLSFPPKETFSLENTCYQSFIYNFNTVTVDQLQKDCNFCSMNLHEIH